MQGSDLRTGRVWRCGWMAPWLVSSLLSPAAHAAVYVYTDPQGHVFIVDHLPDTKFKRRYASPSLPGGSAVAPMIPFSCRDQARLPYADVVNSVSREVGVQSCLLHAMIRTESAYNPRAVSSKGAQGLMQVIPDTAARFGVTQMFDPASNVRAGALYMRFLLGLFGNNLPLALAAYNAGEGAVQKYGNTIPPYPETQVYVTRVMTHLQK